jgi:hypothetical protein
LQLDVTKSRSIKLYTLGTIFFAHNFRAKSKLQKCAFSVEENELNKLDFNNNKKRNKNTKKTQKEQTSEITPSSPQPNTSYANTNNENENAKRSFQR